MLIKKIIVFRIQICVLIGEDSLIINTENPIKIQSLG